MAFPSINSFKNSLLDGGARPSLFTIKILWPAIISSEATRAQLRSEYYCRVAEIPGEQVNVIPFKYAGREVKFAGQRVYSTLRVTIINDEAFTMRRALTTWFNIMNRPEENTMQTSTSLNNGTAFSYGGTAQVTQYGKDGLPRHIFEYIDLFPVTVDPTPLDWQNDAAIEDFSVEFAYQYWERTGVR